VYDQVATAMRIHVAPVATAVTVLFAAAPEPAALGSEAAQPRRYAVDQAWPQALPRNWELGPVTGLAVDAQDHVWVLHRPPAGVPPVFELGPDGRLLSSWGGPGAGFDWPEWPGSISVDRAGTVWIAASGPPEALPPDAAARASATRDAHVLKFTRAGRFVLQIGRSGEPGQVDSQTRLNRPAAAVADAATNEVFVADGGSSQRVAVFDATTGAYKRHFTVPEKLIHRTGVLVKDGLMAHAVRPFTRLSGLALSPDGRVYIADRATSTVHVFEKSGSTLTFGVLPPQTAGLGSIWGMSLSRDPQQHLLFVANGDDSQVMVLNRRNFFVQAQFGSAGTEPGTFRRLSAVAVDSRGVVYTGESYEGHRVQKFIPMLKDQSRSRAIHRWSTGPDHSKP
jgi:DNA-binding beta-propeller fold protein YncE